MRFNAQARAWRYFIPKIIIMQRSINKGGKDIDINSNTLHLLKTKTAYAIKDQEKSQFDIRYTIRFYLRNNALQKYFYCW